ncbi:carbohydrate sulfotransferase 6 [Corythoichthys intestinalis]|uniref:carbohydrate sulfotransferase 6 n=1 Tax=Corythoichthys intestinalis TaxID=161448 RepID=UPI0025A5F12A|nr:carbohydrate sulfotransferase 6 [Corythoichthys intestinalis]XP_057691760.1 carbohydrate sulfotransferase 6 [Corythoichthys intestinalis]XP_057691761.1 carbohydrate sulfotransferase 6 [Corythoichthys intestinalis]XP_061812259.1 carbohydrate sulfotransferase 6 [Nerophis lumbriciformis]
MPRYRGKLNTMIFLLILQGAAVVLLCGWYIRLTPCDSNPSNGKVHVLLLSSWRSGSSFVGQVFSQHPSVFYLMEPAWHIWTKLKNSGAQALRMAVRDLMRSVFHCDFSVTEAYLPERYNVSSLFMWSHSRALCSPPACSLTPRGDFSNQTQCLKTCEAMGHQGVQDACVSYSHVVLKSVRVFELESLYPLFEDPSLDLRIIHLVRDPRAVVRSREQSAKAFVSDSAVVLEQRSIPAAEVQYQVMQEICQSHVRISERALQTPPPFLKGRYKMVRYEDVARNPQEEIRAMYEFVGLDMTNQMEGWIYKLTHGKGKGSVKEAFQITSRNAADVSQAWRTTLPHNKVKRIQEVCKAAMSLFGYTTVNSDKEQKKLDIDLLVPRKPYQFSWLPARTERPGKG